MKFLNANEIEIDKIDSGLAYILKSDNYAYASLTGLKYYKKLGINLGLATIDEKNILKKASTDPQIIIDRSYNPKKISLMNLLNTKTLRFAINPHYSIMVDYPEKYEEHLQRLNEFMPKNCNCEFRDLNDEETKEVKQRLKRRLNILGTTDFFKYSKSKGGWPNFVVYGSNPHTFSDDKHTYNGIKYGLEPVSCGVDEDFYLTVINYGHDTRPNVILDLVKALSQPKCHLVSTDKKVEIDLDDLEAQTKNPYKDLVDKLCKENNIDPLVPLA